MGQRSQIYVRYEKKITSMQLEKFWLQDIISGIMGSV